MSATAELLADRGEAAAGEEFFRARPFLDAERVTHTLRIAGPAVEAAAGEGAVLVAPLVVREIEGTPHRDAISPYGYPGLVPSPGRVPDLSGRSRQKGNSAGERGGVGAAGDSGPALDPGAIDFSATRLVSVFVRHTLAGSPLAGASERNVVQIADPALPPKSRPSDRRQVRRNLEAGYELSLVPGPEATAEQRAGFLDVYEQTMRRADAAPHYFFAAAYFDRILEAERTWLALAHAPGGELAAASLACVGDGFLHYYLSGSADPHLRDSPMKNVLARLCELSTELDLPLNLGGGIRPDDALEEFKRGFANRSQPWQTSELITDEELYNQLTRGRPPGDFFPLYRS